jgi:LTXXQ motif family protein
LTNKQFMAIAISILAIATPVATVAQAQTDSLTQLFPALVGIELKPAQRSQLVQLSQQTLPKVQSLLSAEQLKQFNASLLKGQSVRSALSGVDLSFAQKLRLRNVLQSVKSQLNQTLTPEQQRQAMQNARSLSLSQ